MVDKALDTADNATEDDVQVAALQVRTLQWTAERWNREELGQAKAGSVTVNLGVMMLEALRQPAPARPVISAVIVEDAEVLSIEDATTSLPAQRSTDPLPAAGEAPI